MPNWPRPDFTLAHEALRWRDRPAQKAAMSAKVSFARLAIWALLARNRSFAFVPRSGARPLETSTAALRT
jgi:hypothetical protein